MSDKGKQCRQDYVKSSFYVDVSAANQAFRRAYELMGRTQISEKTAEDFQAFRRAYELMGRTQLSEKTAEALKKLEQQRQEDLQAGYALIRVGEFLIDQHDRIEDSP